MAPSEEDASSKTDEPCPADPSPSDVDESDDWFADVALRVDLLMLEQVEALEDKVANASMQVKVRIYFNYSTLSFILCH